jgi:hypothetical protein
LLGPGAGVREGHLGLLGRRPGLNERGLLALARRTCLAQLRLDVLALGTGALEPVLQLLDTSVRGMHGLRERVPLLVSGAKLGLELGGPTPHAL